ncbi:dienelactone hydrolase family protein [Chiayiivirga flava]|uniref:Carboxymethylenebutenolidase n=1 Tax=Chiayiivirga flava TaxID=659595 RepID=A0A7W8FZJ9_9GAMM|nr:dienelactone hydrolase family protein [Chiayiivirga flava]MBB5206693.1 carboxymethylenebutenolidase [Chiayiivirga flava]
MPAITLHSSAGPLSAWRADPAGQARGAVVVVQEIFGVNGHIRDVTQRFADAGYRAIAPALFDPVEPDVELDYTADGVARGRELVAKLGMDRAVAGVRAAFDALGGGNDVAAVGFCWGGSVAFLANTRLGLASASYYGARTVAYLHEIPRRPLLLHFGGNDTSIPPDDIRKHRDALPTAQVHVYDAGHGFNCDRRADFDAAASALAWQCTLTFLDAALR